jgi:hypothetical protein
VENASGNIYSSISLEIAEVLSWHAVNLFVLNERDQLQIPVITKSNSFMELDPLGIES